jgi:hypothetical protein
MRAQVRSATVPDGPAGTFTGARTNAVCRIDRGYRSGYGRVVTGTRAEYMRPYIKIRKHAGRGSA